jgi:ketosteroid isomerase-like protein
MRNGLSLFVSLILVACATPQRRVPVDAVQQVMETERAFARSMADRNHAAFASFLSEEAVFFDGDEALRGSQAVADGWKKYFEGPAAPFSWEPQRVVVLESGTLALSTGPVYGADGNVVATFNSIWRKEARGTWRIVFDKGSPICNCAFAAIPFSFPFQGEVSHDRPELFLNPPRGSGREESAGQFVVQERLEIVERAPRDAALVLHDLEQQ